MNPLTRLCGQKRGHRLRDLTGDAERVALVHAPAQSMWLVIRSGLPLDCDKNRSGVTAFCHLAIRKVKEYDGQPPQCVAVQTSKPGKVSMEC